MTRKRIGSADLDSPAHRSLEGMCELLLVRHGEQEIREDMALAEATDAPLSPLGQRQAHAVGERLAGARISAIYSSDLARARDTAHAIAGHHDLDPVIRSELREIDLWQRAPQHKRLLEVHPPDELVRIFREGLRSRLHSAFPYCEDTAAFRARVMAAIDRIAVENPDRRVVVACHGGVINTILSEWLGSKYDRLVNVHHTSITTARVADKRRVILTVNDYAHVLAMNDLREWT